MENKVISILLCDDERGEKATFNFENGKSFLIYSEERLTDNLMVITDKKAPENGSPSFSGKIFNNYLCMFGLPEWMLL